MTNLEPAATREPEELTRDEREWLLILADQLHWTRGRPLPKPAAYLVRRGLARHEGHLISLTDKGREVLERVS
jgi:hypothetical protein